MADTPADKVAPLAILGAIQQHGISASLYTRRDGEKTATGCKVTPPVEIRMKVGSPAVEEVVTVVFLSPRDPKLLAVEFPEPRAGDQVTLTRGGTTKTFNLGEGTTAIYSGEQAAAYRLRLLG